MRPARTVLDEPFDGGRVEAQEVSPFDVRDAALADEAAHMADVHGKSIGNLLDCPKW